MFFNKKVKSPTKTINHAGASAYKMTPAQELYAAVVTATLSDKFYETGNGRLLRLRALVAQNDPIFVAKLAIYARERMHLRSVPLVLAIELAKIHRGDDLLSRLIGRVIQRADEITEMLAFYAQANERDGAKQLNRLSKQVQKGIVMAFNKFDAFQFAKYDRDGAAVKLRDALFLTHPVAKDAAQQAIFNQIATGTLETPYTWETELSALGQQKFANEAEKKAAFRAKWQELIDSGKLGYMAMLRNLRNMLGMLLNSKCRNVIAGMFGDTWKVIQLPGRNVLSNVQEFYRREGEVGYSTNGYLVIADLLKRQVPVDKVMLFTDCQLWNSQGTNETLMGLWMDYRKKVAPDAKLYLFDLAGLGNTPFDLRQDQGVALIAGWSDKVFEVLDALENGETAVALIDAIELY